MVAEIQQTSDCTYRIYDYDRVDADGHKRQLHTAEAMDAIDFGGIKGSAAIINGGIINVETAGLGAKGINCDEDIIINGGRTTVVATGDGEWDTEDLETKAVSCINCDSVLTINGGEVYVKASGSGGIRWAAVLAVADGKIRVEPYNNNRRNCVICIG
jgi:mannose-6-phosphate isomerase class I